MPSPRAPCDIALALGVEKLKDTGYGGLPQRSRGVLNSMYWANVSAPGSFAQLASAYRAKHGVAARGAEARDGAHLGEEPRQRRQQPQGAPAQQDHRSRPCSKAPMVAEPLGLFDCCGVSDGAACAIVTTPEIARALGKARPRHGQGAAARRLERHRGAAQFVGRQLFRDHAHRRQARLRGGRHQEPARRDLADRGARLLLDHRARHHGGPPHLAGRAARSRTCSTASTTPTAACPARSTAGSSASAIPSAPLACACSTRSICRSRAARASASARTSRALGLTHNLGGFPHQNVSSVVIVGRQ